MSIHRSDAGCWTHELDSLEINISLAWSLLARLGLPARFGGRAPDGSYEYFISDPLTGGFLARGKGQTIEESMCDAAFKCARLPRFRLDKRQDGRPRALA